MKMKENIIIFGAGGTGTALYHQLKSEYNVVAFLDNYKRGQLEGIPVLPPSDINNLHYDAIFIASVAMHSISKQLHKMGINKSKIIQSYVESKVEARNNFLKQYAEEIYRKKIKGNVAEAGVFRGDFAALINYNFPDRQLYLFDTFEGFDERDIEFEAGYEENPEKGDYFRETSVETVMTKMPYPEQVIIKKGYVPETFTDVSGPFCFVNLDMDLYKPTLEALKFFFPLIVDGGGILVHDYFDTNSFTNLKNAVIEFAESVKAKTFPIGDNLSIFIVK